MPCASRWRKSAPYRSVSQASASSRSVTGPSPDEQRQHRPDALHAAEGGQALLEPRTGHLQLLVHRPVAQPPQHGEPGRGRQRVPGQRPGLVHVADGGEALHHVRPAAERRERKSAADDLPEDGQIRRHAVALLGTAARDAEAGDHLVEDEERARRVAEHDAGPRGSRAPAGRRPCFRQPARRRCTPDPRPSVRPPLRLRRRRCTDRRSCLRRHCWPPPASPGFRAWRRRSRQRRAARRRGRGSSRRT